VPSEVKGKRYSEEQVLRVLKEIEAGKTIAAVCREQGLSEQTVYRWRSKHAGMEEADVHRLRALREENRRLKRLVAESSLDNQALKELAKGNW
jgi:putative transposase